MNKSANLVQMDALWRAYIDADPDLRRLEDRKRALYHRRLRKEIYGRDRRELGREILNDLLQLVGAVGTIALGLLVLVFLIWLDGVR